MRFTFYKCLKEYDNGSAIHSASVCNFIAFKVCSSQQKVESNGPRVLSDDPLSVVDVQFILTVAHAKRITLFPRYAKSR